MRYVAKITGILPRVSNDRTTASMPQKLILARSTAMPFEPDAIQQVVRIPLRCIDQQYGKDNHDNAGDDMIYCLRQASDTDAQYNFAFSTDHANPWYHTLDFTAEKLTEAAYERLIELLATHGLTEE